MLGKKSWRTISEEALSLSSSAWAWMREYISKDFKSKGIKLRDSQSLSQSDFVVSRFVLVICLRTT
jgi:hypothetical protein